MEDIDPYSLPAPDNHPGDIAERVMRMPEHQHLVDNEIDVGWLMRNFEKVKGGRIVLGSVHEPTCNGELAPMFEWMVERLFGRLPRFLVILDAEYWAAATDHQREILIFHNLCKIRQKLDRYGSPRFDQDGMPVYGIHATDVDEFIATVARYGAHTPEIASFVSACNGN